jgi:hypothetical protein
MEAKNKKNLSFLEYLKTIKPDLFLNKKFKSTKDNKNIVYGNEYTAILYCGDNYIEVNENNN